MTEEEYELLYDKNLTIGMYLPYILEDLGIIDGGMRFDLKIMYMNPYSFLLLKDAPEIE